ncbi:peptidoglycan-binding protein [Brevibacterium sp. 50QC2O2]|jgi:N-acetylmuramoyl-L-alanine amidase|uniref:N-acetylmuramoyl-L-alanine amidase n=1 Tax=Brevibacterium TaxID=1696 RepID=UPI00211CDC7D|nr:MULTISPECIES: peptidoglycan-binding protein [unclassified Brevibacterium]MCQ9368688.1 peptidoglycan-binding protein [Brevibacterium sp. 91QC2O2]MCQ9386441.1 peptidoglycan-binding protein [Brevibacterium sp. 68QC2CO]MCQ9389521.1 peptidoglycan-binding protein [Brevibacterium sp. 50QC2O2]
MSNTPLPRFRRGDTDPVIATTKAQLARLNINVGDIESPVFDAAFDSAIRQFQQDRGIFCDGVLNGETFAQVELARYRLGDRVLRYDPSRMMAGDDVVELQQRLATLGIYTESIDYYFGPLTDSALREAQQDLGLKPDGIAGPATYRALDDVRRGSATGNLFALRERVRRAAEGPSLAGRTFVVEAATTGRDFRAIPLSATHAQLEQEISQDIARRIEGRLSALGAAVVFARADSSATLADELGASLIITVNQDFYPTPDPNGVATYYFGVDGDPTHSSPVGELAADLVQKEVVARTGMTDCHTHAKTWQTLRVTRTPKVFLMAGYLTNPKDRADLETAAFRDAIAEGVVIALQRIYLKQESDPTTGTLRVADIHRLLDPHRS